jgi:hypothetical protein
MVFHGGTFHPGSSLHLQSGEEIGSEEISMCLVSSPYLCTQAAREHCVTMLFNHKSKLSHILEQQNPRENAFTIFNQIYNCTMFFNTRSSPSSGDLVGMIGSPFSKKIIGVFIGSNFSGAHHLEYNSKVF